MDKKTLLPLAFVAALFLLTAPAFGQDAKAPQKGPAPVISCAVPEHDFGSVAAGEDVKHTFKIRNTGKGVLKIERARGG